MSSFVLKKVPEDVLKTILKVQGEIKVKRGITIYSLESAVYYIIKKYRELTEVESDQKKDR